MYEVESEDQVYHRGVYRGIPFELRYDRITPWEAVDPKRADKANGVLMCSGRSRGWHLGTG